MSARYEISDADHGAIRVSHPSAHLPHEFVCIHPGSDPWSAFSHGVIRQQSADIAERDAVIAACAGAVGASVSPGCSDEFRAMLPGEIRALVNQLRTDLAAVAGERDRIKGDYGEAAHFARHFIRDDAAITPRGAIIRLGDKCTSLFARMKIAETERDEWIACHAQLYRKLGNLLAVIHRDGGHYESEHGTEKACEDAETAVHVMRGCVDGFISSANEWRQRAEQAEARLSAIDSAPVVARPKFIRGEICGCQTRPTHYVGEMDCPWHKRGDGQPKEAKD